MATIKDLKRMCDAYEWCGECPLNGTWSCSVSGLPDNADEIVDEWVEEHSVKTYAMDFFEKFPNASKDRNGAPRDCWKHIYGGENVCTGDCTKCWTQEMKEDE